jgi:hypothetical protein
VFEKPLKVAYRDENGRNETEYAFPYVLRRAPNIAGKGVPHRDKRRPETNTDSEPENSAKPDLAE